MEEKVAEGHEIATEKLCQPSCNWESFSNHGRIRQRKQRDGLRLSSAVPKITPTALTAIKLLDYGKPLPLLP